VLGDEVCAIDVCRVGGQHGHLCIKERWGIDLALETFLDLQSDTPLRGDHHHSLPNASELGSSDNDASLCQCGVSSLVSRAFHNGCEQGPRSV